MPIGLLWRGRPTGRGRGPGARRPPAAAWSVLIAGLILFGVGLWLLFTAPSDATTTAAVMSSAVLLIVVVVIGGLQADPGCSGHQRVAQARVPATEPAKLTKSLKATGRAQFPDYPNDVTKSTGTCTMGT